MSLAPCIERLRNVPVASTPRSGHLVAGRAASAVKRLDLRGRRAVVLAVTALLAACSAISPPPRDAMVADVVSAPAIAPTLSFDPRDPGDKSPSGAVAAGTEVAFSVEASAGVDAVTLVIDRLRAVGDASAEAGAGLVRVPLVRAASSAADGRVAWRAAHRFPSPAIYEYWFEARIGGHARVVADDARRIDRTAPAAGPAASSSSVVPFHQTVHAAGLKMPDWAQDAVHYAIAPGHFRDGTLDGVTGRLDYIAALGANTLDLAPVFVLDTDGAAHVDPRLGTDADFRRLCAEADKRSLRIVVDAGPAVAASRAAALTTSAAASGVAGWRVEMAPTMPGGAARVWRAAIKAPKADALAIAASPSNPAPYLLGDEFDTAASETFARAVIDYASGGDATRMMDALEREREALPPPARGALLNPLSTARAGRALRRSADAAAMPAPADRAKQRLRLAVFFQMTWPGAPVILAGDEVGLDDDAADVPWADRGGHPDAALRADVMRLARLRRNLPLLRRGELLAPLHVDANVVVLARRLGPAWALTATNNADTPRTVTVALPADAPGRWADAMTPGPELAAAPDRTLTLVAPAHFGIVLRGDAVPAAAAPDAVAH